MDAHLNTLVYFDDLLNEINLVYIHWAKMPKIKKEGDDTIEYDTKIIVIYTYSWFH